MPTIFPITRAQRIFTSIAYNSAFPMQSNWKGQLKDRIQYWECAYALSTETVCLVVQKQWSIFIHKHKTLTYQSKRGREPQLYHSTQFRTRTPNGQNCNKKRYLATNRSLWICWDSNTILLALIWDFYGQYLKMDSQSYVRNAHQRQ